MTTIKKTILLSVMASSLLVAETVHLDEVQIEENVNSVIIKDISGDELKSADLAESLVRKVPSISLVRRSGIANDIILRGQKKDNINILADGTKTYGACPNRMDPATSHILTNNIESIEIIEGPYDVENFGTLSGLVDIKTKKPTEEFSGEVNLNAGSFGYKKASATLSGGFDKFRFLLSASKEKSDQYEDGDGNDFSEQVNKYVAKGTQVINASNLPGPVKAKKIAALKGTAYHPGADDLEAYDKETFMGKIFFNPTDNQELRFSYTANRSDDVLYPSSKMDATKDDSDIYNLEYSIRDMGSWSKQLDMQLYKSTVDHPMSTINRMASLNPMMGIRENTLTTEMQGAKIKNLVEIYDAKVTLGLDASKRNWDGYYTKNDMPTGTRSINDVNTKNTAVFGKYEQTFGMVDLELGSRYDDASIRPDGAQQNNHYSVVSGYGSATVNTAENTELFLGAGKSIRVPDARELYFVGYMGNEQGTPNLKEVKNYEIDLGVKQKFNGGFVKAKLFHSWLKDYIYFNSDNKNMMGIPVHSFENIDAKIYGAEINALYSFSEAFYFDAGMAYQRGKKDDAMFGQSDRDLAEIPPLKFNSAFHYDTDMISSQIELIAADQWDDYDSDNGEQDLSGYAVINMKVNADLTHGFDITVGVDNVFDKTYAVTNTYNDLTLLTTGTSSDQVMLMNEPGRYMYVNARYRF